MISAAARSDHPEILFAKPTISADRRTDGSIILKSTTPLQRRRAVRRRLARTLGAADAGADFPRRPRQRRRAVVGPSPMPTRCGRSARRPAWILAQRLSAERPLVILSDNSVDHALFALAAQHVRRALGGDLPAYSLMSRDFDKLKGMIKLLGPGAIFVSSTKTVCGGAGGDCAAAFGPYRQQRRRGCRDDFVPLDRGNAGNAGCRQSLCGHHAGHDRKIPVHLGFDRHAEGRHQHPAHADLEPAGQGADLGRSSTVSADLVHPRLAALEPHASAPTTISIWCCAMAARSISTAASRRRGCLRLRWPICAA